MLAIIEKQPGHSPQLILSNILSAKQEEVSSMTKLQKNTQIERQDLELSQQQITKEYQEYKLLRGLENTLPAKLGNFAGGLVGTSLGVIAAPINAIWSLAAAGLKNVTIDMPNLISSRYNDNKKGKKWAQSFRASFDQLRKNKEERAQTRFVNKLKTEKKAKKSSRGLN